MIRIMIYWDFISPALKTASGVVSLDYRNNDDINDKSIAKFRVTIEPNSLSYKALTEDKGYWSTAFEAVRPQLDVMVRSYYEGMVLYNKTYYWVIEEDLEKAMKHLKNVPLYIEKENLERIYKEVSITS